jgi:hypothetical protein
VLSSLLLLRSLSPAYELYDFNLGARADGGLRPIRLPDNLAIHFHCDAFGIDTELAQQSEHAKARIDAAGLAI